MEGVVGQGMDEGLLRRVLCEGGRGGERHEDEDGRWEGGRRRGTGHVVGWPSEQSHRFIVIMTSKSGNQLITSVVSGPDGNVSPLLHTIQWLAHSLYRNQPCSPCSSLSLSLSSPSFHLPFLRRTRSLSITGPSLSVLAS